MKVAKIEANVIGHYGTDLEVVNAARVSFAKASEWQWPAADMEAGNPVLATRDKKLIEYLAKHKHFSPFNHTFISTRIKAPLFVARQLQKHRFMPWNETSRRYVDDEPEFYFPDTWRSRAENVKQGSGLNLEDDEQLDAAFHSQRTVEQALASYTELLNLDVAPEQARMVLPQNTMTEWIWSGTLGAWADMLRLRLDPHTQAESRDVAKLIYDQVLPLFPVSLPALLNTE